MGPLGPRMLPADAECRERLMPPSLDLVRLRAAEDVDDMMEADAEAALLLDAEHAGEELLPCQSAVDPLARGEAVVAGAAGDEGLAVAPPVRLAEILEELDAAALGALAELDELGEVLAGHRPLLLIAHLVDEAVQPDGVGGAVEEHAFARHAVAAGAARLLVVALDVLGQVVVQDEPDVGLVDAHAKRDGGDDDLDPVLDEEVLPLGAFGRIEAGVVGTRGDSLPGQGLREILGALASHAVDNAALAPV